MRTDRDVIRRTSAESPSDRAVGASERRGERPTDDGLVSRRSFVLASGVPISMGWVDSVGRLHEESDQRVDVSVTEPYRAAMAALLESTGMLESDEPVRLHASDTNPYQALRSGRIDVHVCGRPSLGSDADSAETLQRTAGLGRAVLTHGTHEWRDCLRGPELRERWSNDRPVETWSEVDPASESAVGRIDVPDTDRVAGRRDPSSMDRTTLVRGRRSFQYARGHGGVGYYPADPTEIRLTAAARDGPTTPLSLVGYVHIDGDAAEDAGPVLRKLDEHESHRDVANAYFVDPRATENPDAAVGPR